jgi:VanZ family protein
MPAYRFRRAWLTIGWALVAYTVYVSLSSSPPDGPGWLSDKLAHGLTYFVLAAWFAALFAPRDYVKVGLGLLGLGIAIELLQARTGYRYAEVADGLANLAGIVAGLAFGLATRGRWLAWFDRRLAAAVS